MTVRELLNTEISFYNKINEYTNKKITLMDFLKLEAKYKDIINKARIKYNNKEEYDKIKHSLPCATISCICGKSKSESDIIKLNNILVIDIDHIENVDEVKHKVLKNHYIFLAQKSVSGKGVMALAYINDSNKFREHYKAIYEDFKKQGIEIDKQCGNPNRLRFISYDDNVLIKYPDDEVYPHTELPQKETSIYDSKEGLSTPNEFTFKAIYYLIKEQKYRANDYETWLYDGFRLATFGELGHLLFMYLSEVSDNFNETSAEQKFKECVRTTKMDKACLSYYFKLLKDKDKNWIEVINSYEVKL